jgi:hypothetical protein
MRHLAFVSLSLSTCFAAACATHEYSPTDPNTDTVAPTVTITSPARGTILGDVPSVEVAGTATDNVGVTGLTINGATVAVADDGTWTTTITAQPGTQLIHAIALDAAGNQGQQTRAVVTGPMVPFTTWVPQAITAAMSAQTFAAIGQGASGYINTTDLEALISPHNPVYSAGSAGATCLYARVNVTTLTEQNAVITLTPVAGGLMLDAELDNLDVGLDIDYAVACLSDDHPASATADHLSVTGLLQIGIGSDGTFSTTLQNPNVNFTNLDLELGGIPGDIVDLLDLQDDFGGIMGYAIEQFMGPVVDSSLAGMTGTHSLAVLNSTVDVTVQPATMTFDSTGAILDLNSSMRAEGDTAGSGSGYVFVARQAPTMSDSQGFELAVVDGAANQLMASLWSAGGLNDNLDLTTGPYGNIGQLYDTAVISAAVPPYVDLAGSGMTLTLGDILVQFSLKGQLVTSIAVNASVTLQVTANAQGALQLGVGTPTVYVDVDSQGVTGANELSGTNFQIVAQFALSRLVSYASSALGAVALPSIGGVSLQNLTVAADSGYLMVEGTAAQ